MNKPWRVGYKPIDKATAKPIWSGLIFENFTEASRAAQALNSSDLSNHYFPDLLPETHPEKCTDCGLVFESELLKPPPDPKEKGRLCPFCYKHAKSVFAVNGSLHNYTIR